MEISQDKKTALLFGEASQIGQACLSLLLENPAYQEVKVWSTQKIQQDHPKLEVLPFDPDRMDRLDKELIGQDLFCCYQVSSLKTIHLREPDRVYFPKVYQIAVKAATNKVNQFFLLSSVNANPKAMLPIDRIRGVLERELKALPFWATHIFRPSLIVKGDGDQNWGESVASEIEKGLNFITGGLVRKYKPIQPGIVAKAMVHAGQRLEPGQFIYNSDELQDWAIELKAGRFLSK